MPLSYWLRYSLSILLCTASSQCVVNKMAAVSLRFRSVSEGAADKVLNNQYLELPCDTNLELRMY